MHNTFVHPLKFDELLIKVILLCFYKKIKISQFVQRWENARAVTRYQNLNFLKKWTYYLCAVNY